MPFPNRETQFKKSVSGNPAGRPRGAKNRSSVLAEMIAGTRFAGVPKPFIRSYCKGRKRIRQRDIFACWEAYHGIGE